MDRRARVVVASFFQHTSRDHDPQLHIHNAILNRVQCSDGVWRTLDCRALHLHRPEAAAVAERVTEEHVCPHLRSGVDAPGRQGPRDRRRARGGHELFSHRRRAITPKTGELVAAFERRFGREPTALELDRLQRRAWAITRAAKPHDGRDGRGAAGSVGAGAAQPRSGRTARASPRGSSPRRPATRRRRRSRSRDREALAAVQATQRRGPRPTWPPRSRRVTRLFGGWPPTM